MVRNGADPWNGFMDDWMGGLLWSRESRQSGLGGDGSHIPCVVLTVDVGQVFNHSFDLSGGAGGHIKCL
jgi:hypothetical protein